MTCKCVRVCVSVNATFLGGFTSGLDKLTWAGCSLGNAPVT